MHDTHSDLNFDEYLDGTRGMEMAIKMNKAAFGMQLIGVQLIEIFSE